MKSRLPFVCVPVMFLQHCFYLVDGRRVLLPADLVRLKVDLIVVTGGPQALAAKKATTTIPIVMTNIWDPVGAGQARRAAGGATEEIRAHHQSESGEADRPHDSA